jgi:hypothetical protein
MGHEVQGHEIEIAGRVGEEGDIEASRSAGGLSVRF